MIDKLTIAASDPDAMARFYGAVLGVDFVARLVPGAVLHLGVMGATELWIVPKGLAGISSRESTMQPRFVVPDVRAAVAAAMENGGIALGDVEDLGPVKLGAVRDPDGNSVELIER